ncbi:MAG: hypothetical protein WCE44_11860 [Candidatus Velthaea sp.]
MRRTAAALGASLVLASPLAARAETVIGGIALGTPLPAALQSAGKPAAARSQDNGNRISWSNARGAIDAYVDDDGIVDAVVFTPPPATPIAAQLDGKPHAFITGTYTADQADAQLAASAQFSDATTRTYEPENGRELVLIFDSKTQTLRSVAYGSRGAIARLGYVKADDIAKSVPFHAAILNRSAITDGGPGPAALIAYSVDRHGVVKAVNVLAPSGVAAFDDRIANGLLDDKFTPAKLGGREIASTYYREVHAQ